MRRQQDEDDDELDDREDPDESDMDDDDDSADCDTVPCPHCRKPVYEEADVCPHCGSFIARQHRTRHPTWVLVAAVLLLAAIGYGLLSLLR